MTIKKTWRRRDEGAFQNYAISVDSTPLLATGKAWARFKVTLHGTIRNDDF